MRIPSVGERLLPYLFAAMETCCIDVLLIGLASFSFLSLLVPLWSPFVFIAGFYWIASYMHVERNRRHANTSSFGTFVVIVLMIAAMPVTLWLSVYASSFSFF